MAISVGRGGGVLVSFPIVAVLLKGIIHTFFQMRLL